MMIGMCCPRKGAERWWRYLDPPSNSAPAYQEISFLLVVSSSILPGPNSYINLKENPISLAKRVRILACLA
ncbi:hypothetical protein EUGRSUZ_I00362 [Eucalyptus grandis]|uniref:Uncharacterized protein n=2 Tax=Eucalyptus grandis TaxID=71139 RepID=A0ACC3JC96_EUCGR|nr:hypothetical protein EUGRSUZ_I00362 [Eucalyptus grandis]